MEMLEEPLTDSSSKIEMSEESLLDAMPTEMLLHIFSFMKAKYIVKCRAVSFRWKQIIDAKIRSDYFWKRQCEVEFNSIHKVARVKCQTGMDWSDLYRSLTIWSKLKDSREHRSVLCSAALVRDEIRSFEILPDGEIGVHTRSAIVYYDIETLEPVKRSPITGDFMKYSENDKVTAVLSYHMFLYIRKKVNTERPVKATYDDVKTFLLLDHAIYYVDVKNNLYVCNIDAPTLTNELVVHSGTGIVSVGFCKNKIHVLTLDQIIYTVKDNELMYVASLEEKTNLLHLFNQYNFLELLDWRTYFHWIYVLKHSIPRGPLEEILIIRMYGDVVFVGCNWGVLRIYYNPFPLGMMDIFNTAPIKEYNFMQWIGNMHCMYPILNVDVKEAKNGHAVFVAMPKKIVVINFTHHFKKTLSISVLPPSPDD